MLLDEDDMTGMSTTEQVPPLPALEEVKVPVPSTAVVEHIDHYENTDMLM